MDLDDLFGDGVQLADDFLVKAELRLRIKDHRLPAAQDLISKLEAAYDARLVLLVADLEQIVANADARKSLGLYVVDGGLPSTELRKATVFIDNVFKADQPKLTQSGQPRAPHGSGEQAKRDPMDESRAGSKGGKWYKTKTGKIRYGTKPQEHDEREATPEEVAEHAKAFRPGPFMGLAEGDQALVGYMRKHGDELGMSPTATSLFKFWYGEKNEEGELEGGAFMDAFIEEFWPLPKAKTKGAAEALRAEKAREDMKGDLSQLKLSNEAMGLDNVPFEEAVMHFWGAQDFWPREDLSEDERAERFEAKIKPVLESMAEDFEALKTNPAVHKHVAEIGKQVEERTYNFYVKSHAIEDHAAKWASTYSSMNPTEQVTSTLSAMAAMGLVFIPTAGETAQAKRLRGVVAPNWELLGEASSLLEHDPKRLEELNSGQLMMIYAAGQLAGMFNSDTRKYDHEPGADHSSAIGDHAFDLLATKLGIDGDETAKSMLKDRLSALSIASAEGLSKANTGKDPLLKKFVEAGAGALDPAKAAKIQQAVQKQIVHARDALEAQADDNFALPKSMAGGVLGAEHHGASPLDHHKILGPDGKEQVDPASGKVKTFSLFKHQRQALNWMLKAARGVLALDAGMGKTPTVITFCEHLRDIGKLKEGEQVQLFLPPSVMGQWPSEIRKYAPNIKDEDILNLGGMSLAQRKAALTSDLAKKAKYIIISVGTLNGPGKESAKDPLALDYDPGTVNDGSGGTDDEMQEMLKAIKGPVFIDEVHTGGFKDAKTTRHQVAKAVMAGREHAFGLTATPMPNGPMDLYHLANLFQEGQVGTLDEWEGSTAGVSFDDETHKWNVTNPEGLMAMRERVRPYVMHREITDPEVVKDIGKQMGDRHQDPDLKELRPPDDHPIYEWTKPDGHCDLIAHSMYARLVKNAEEEDAEVARLHAAGKSKEADKLGSGERLAGIEKNEKFIRGMLRDNLRRKAEISPELIDKRYTGGSPKIDRFVADVVKHFKGGGGTEDAPVVMFSSLPGSSFPIVKKALVAAGIDPSLIGEIHGGKSGKERSFEQDMTNAGKRKILLIGTKSGGAGLNLQKKANRVFFLDQPMDPASKRQAVGRVWRPGQKRTVMESNYTMWSQHGETWDQKTQRNLVEKQAMVSAMLSDVDLSSIDFTKKTKDAVAGLGLKASRRAKKQEVRKQLSPEMEHLVANMDIDAMLKDPEDEKVTPQSLGQLLDPEKRKELIEQAKGLGQNMDVAHEQKLWDRQDDMQNMSNQWRLQKVLLSTAKPEDKDKIRASTARMVLRAKSYRGQIEAEAKTAIEAGNHKVAEALMKQGDAFTDSLPDVFKQAGGVTDSVIVEQMIENPELAEAKPMKIAGAGGSKKKTPEPAPKKTKAK